MSIRPLAVSPAEIELSPAGPAVSPPSGQLGRKTIGVLMNYMTHFMGSYESNFRHACDAMGHKFDVHVSLVYGGAFGRPNDTTIAQNAIFDQVRHENIDGLILLSTTLASFCGSEAIGRFAEKFGAFPRCSVGLELAGIPSIVIDNQRSMQAVFEHMVVTHGCLRVAYIGGAPKNPESQLRSQAYRDVLDRNGIAFDPKLVTDGHFTTSGGSAAMEVLIAREGKFDAAVAANDMMALVAIRVLRQHGYLVPRDMPVTGFDGLQVAALEIPPLTTVSQPFALIAERAFRLVLDQMGGHPVEQLSEIVAGFVVRRSCGCGQRHVAPSGKGSAHQAATPSDYLRVQAGPLL